MYNKVVLVGNLARDPESRKAGDHTVTEFSVAVNSLGKKEQTTFINIQTWNKVAENCAKYLKKGSRVLVDGELRQDTWEAEDGSKRSKYYVNTNVVQFFNTRIK